MRPPKSIRAGILFFSLIIIATTTAFLLRTNTTKPFQSLTDIEISVWAQEPMLKNTVAISHDAQGRIYATEGNRRKSTDLDVREMFGLEPLPWPVLDYSITSIDERRQTYFEYLAPDSPYNNPWLKDFDGDGQKNWRDLYSISERVNVLEDTNGDGKADKASVFAEDFNSELTGTAAGVLWHNNKVYFTVIPDLWLLQDTDNDNKADKRESLLTGHGVHIGQGGHDLHGLTLGPDGRIYWSIGDKGINITSKEGKQFYYPNQGLIMRSEPDGRNFEVFAMGLRNCMELAFDDYGNLFCVDNDGDFQGERERLVYVTEGSDTGWRINWQYNLTNKWAQAQRLPEYNPWMEEHLAVPHFEGQAAYITPTLQNYSDGPAGFTRNPGTALSAEYENFYFLTEFPGQKISAFRLVPDGAAFKMEDEHLFKGGFMATGLSFGPDGALYVADWGGEWHPTEQGGIMKVDVSEEKKHPLRAQTQQLISEGMQNKSVADLIALLDYADQRVRMEAQFELVRRQEAETLHQTALDNQQPLQARAHAIWGLGQLARNGQVSLSLNLSDLLEDAEAQIRIQACRLVGEAPALFARFEPNVVQLLEDENLSVRFHAAQALGKLGNTSSAEAINELLASNSGSDPVIRHGGVTALAGIGDVSALVAATAHPSNNVRLASVLALRRLKSPEVAQFLSDENLYVALEAARAIHDDLSIPEALPALAALLNQTPHASNEALMRRVLNANLRVGDILNVKAVVDYLLSGDANIEMQKEAFNILQTWSNPPVLDRVERRYRALPARDPGPISRHITSRLAELFEREDLATSSLLSLITHYEIQVPTENLQTKLAEDTQPAADRIAILNLITQSASGVSDADKNDAIQTAFSSNAAELRMRALEIQASRNEPAALRYIKNLLNAAAGQAERQHTIKILGSLKSEAALNELKKHVADLRQGKTSPQEQLDVFMAAMNHNELAGELAAIRTQAGEGTPVPYAFTRYGGDVQKGESVFLKHAAAQCIRCHAISEEGGSTVGPNLMGIGNKLDRALLLESLISPSAQLAEGFGAGSGGISAMPPMGGILTPDELRDVIAYLASL